MKRALLILSISAMFFITGCVAAQQEETTEEQVSSPPVVSDQPESAPTMEAESTETGAETKLQLGDFPLAFAFADLSGDRLLIHCDEDSAAYEEDPERHSLAIGPYGESVNITYAGWQDRTEESNYRQAAYNFEHLPGYLYRPDNGKLQPDQTYCLTAEGMLDKALIPLLPPPGQVSDPYASNPALDEETTRRIIELKSRGIVWTEQLAVTVDGAQIGLVLFERQGDNMLFSIAYFDNKNALFWDCPADYDEYSTWRVDMGDEPGMFTPLFLARSETGLVLSLTWGAAEGEIIVLLHEDNGELINKSDYTYYRYWMPE